MHIPDGYLSPATAGALYVAAVPFWAIAVRRVRVAMGGRTVPLLAIFSAFTFAIMMFNVPVPGGTTAHGVGGTLAAIVLGPWAAVISTSVALILQALFFGDGGIVAIGANCFNMGVALPLAGWVVYRLIAGRSPGHAQRRVVAAAIGAYAGITLSALLVGTELGVQPIFWSAQGVPQYSPYGLATAIPAMLLAHLFGASFVEAAITALGVGYLQRTMPELLGGGADDAPGAARRGWIVTVGVVLASIAAIVVAGLLVGGDLGHWGGLDWSVVDWAAAGQTVLVSVIVSAIALPALAFVLRGRPGWRAVTLLFVALVIWFPVGLIAPGGAWGEEASATQVEVDAALAARAAGNPALFDALPAVNRECGCVPAGLANGTLADHAVLGGYQPPWVHADDPAWRQSLGYQAAGAVGLLAIAIVVWLLARVMRWFAPAPPMDWRTSGE